MCLVGELHILRCPVCRTPSTRYRCPDWFPTADYVRTAISASEHIRTYIYNCQYTYNVWALPQTPVGSQVKNFDIAVVVPGSHHSLFVIITVAWRRMQAIAWWWNGLHVWMGVCCMLEFTFNIFGYGHEDQWTVANNQTPQLNVGWLLHKRDRTGTLLWSN